MNPSEKPKFEQEWQRLFESASETPPPSAWEGIEKRLDDNETVIVPLLWWKNPKLFYAAAAVAALLLLSWPILRLTQTRNTPQAVSPGMRPDIPQVAAVPQADESAPAVSGQKGTTAGSETDAFRPNRRTAANATTPHPSTQRTQDRSKRDVPRLDGTPAARSRVGVPRNVFEKDALTPLDPTTVAFAVPDRKNEAIALNKNPDAAEPGVPDENFTPVLNESIALMAPVGPSERNVYMQKRYVHYRYEFPEPESAPRSRSRELWAGLGIMPASFNPRVNVTSSPLAFANAKAGRQALASSSKPQLSYALQMQGGKKLSKRWSVEMGLSYLQGNSTFQSDGYVLNTITNHSANVLEDALFSGNYDTNSTGQQPGFAAGFDKNAGSYIELTQRTSNDYRYVQLPVQAGYTLNPDGRMNYTLLAGVVGNLFLQNEVQSAQGYSFKNTADDGLYRSLNWSAATGVRVSYRLSNHWNASLTGSYQKAVASILRDNSTLDSRPRLYGMAWGVQYVF